MHTARRILLVLFILSMTASASPAAGETEIHPLRPFTARYAMSRGGQPWATAVIQLEKARVDGRPAFRHSFSLHFEKQTVYDETLFLAGSLRPVMKLIHGGLPPEVAYKLYTYQDGGIRGSNVFEDGRDPVPLKASFEGKVYGAGTSALILASSPLAEGWSTTFRLADDAGIHPDTVRVESRETIRAAGRSYRAWVISIMGGKGRQWIVEQPPYLVRQEFPEAGIVWELSEVLRDRPLVADAQTKP